MTPAALECLDTAEGALGRALRSALSGAPRPEGVQVGAALRAAVRAVGAAQDSEEEAAAVQELTDALALIDIAWDLAGCPDTARRLAMFLDHSRGALREGLAVVSPPPPVAVAPVPAVAEPSPASGASESDADRVLWRKELQEKAGVSSETVRLWVKAGRLPPPDVQLSRQRQGWRLSTLRARGLQWA